MYALYLAIHDSQMSFSPFSDQYLCQSPSMSWRTHSVRSAPLSLDWRPRCGGRPSWESRRLSCSSVERLSVWEALQ